MIACPYCASSLTKPSQTCPVCGARLTSPALEIGALLAGQYRIEEVLGQGGFGITYLALDETLDHRVAIKELFPEGSAREGANVVPLANRNFAETKQKFLEEALVVQRFNHRNIVRVYGTLEENHTAYIVMEALSGSTLTSDVTSNGAFPEASVLEMARQLCAALVVVHEAGLLHRDIKPDNVFLTSDARVVLIDFGSARSFAVGQVKRLTRLLTPGYAAPEQYASQAAFGAYTDVYGLAATLYYALEGRMPPMATELMLGERLEFEKAGTLRAGLEAGLKIKIGERPQTMQAFLNALEQPLPTAPLEVLAEAANARSSVPIPAIYVQGWRFESDRFQRALREFYFQDIQGITVKQTRTSPNIGNHLTVFILLGGGCCLFGFIIRSPFLIFPGILMMSLGGAQSKIASQNPPPARWGVWIETQNGEAFLDNFDLKQDALRLGQEIRNRSSARLDVVN